MENTITNQLFEEMINQVEINHPISVSLKLELKKLLFQKDCKKDSRVLNCGQSSKKIWFLHAGSAREVYCNEQTFEEKTTWFWFKGDLCYPLVDISHGSMPSSIELMEDSTLIYISSKNLQHLMRHFPEAKALFKMLKKHCYLKRAGHNNDVIHMTAKNRVEKLLKKRPNLLLISKQKFILEFLEIKSDSLSRYL